MDVNRTKGRRKTSYTCVASYVLIMNLLGWDFYVDLLWIGLELS